MTPVLTHDQIASMTPEQRTYYGTLPEYVRPLIGRQILEWSLEQRRLRQVERKRRFQAAEITRQQFDALSEADPEPPMQER